MYLSIKVQFNEERIVFRHRTGTTDIHMQKNEDKPLNLTTYDSAVPLLDIYLREMNIQVHTKTHTQMFTATLLKTAKSGNDPNIHQLMKG